jgi:hypothetical protein
MMESKPEKAKSSFQPEIEKILNKFIGMERNHKKMIGDNPLKIEPKVINNTRNTLKSS